jgi:hypothetical protein
MQQYISSARRDVERCQWLDVDVVVVAAMEDHGLSFFSDMVPVQ